MAGEGFFDERKEQSLIKTRIVEKYFYVWSKVIISTQKRFPNHPQKIAYIDLFAGPGRFKDGTTSTPLNILANAVAYEDLRQRLITIFNDRNEIFTNDLINEIEKIPHIDTMVHKPVVYNHEIGEEIIALFNSTKLIPTLFFVDPWGYKGLSLRLINSVLKDWGCDALFFFNYNRINMGLNNDLVMDHMHALFGEEQVIKLRNKLCDKSSRERELIIIEELCQTIKSYCYNFVLPFRFKNARGERTSHHLIFVSKNFKGYEIMKEIMAGESTSDSQGVPSFEYNPADMLPQQALLFQLDRPLDSLENDLLNLFRGRCLNMRSIYENHNVDTPYIKKNYKEVLRKLYENKAFDAISPNGKPPRKGTFGDDIMVTFPR